MDGIETENETIRVLRDSGRLFFNTRGRFYVSDQW